MEAQADLRFFIERHRDQASPLVAIFSGSYATFSSVAINNKQAISHDYKQVNPFTI